MDLLRQDTSNKNTKEVSPPGFRLGPHMDLELIKQAKTYLLLQDRYAWRDESGKISRYTINYGWNYVSMEKDNYEFVELPPIIDEIRSALVTKLQPHIKDPQIFDNVIVTIYEPEHYLLAHYDADDSKEPLTKRNFYFREPIIGVLLEADPSRGFSFYYHEKEGRPSLESPPVYQVAESDGATFLIEGESRHAPYFHGIPTGKNRRISITMRQTVLPNKATSS